MESAERAVGDATPDEDALTLQVPYDGTVGPSRALLDRLDGQQVPLAGCRCTPPISTTSSSP